MTSTDLLQSHPAESRASTQLERWPTQAQMTDNIDQLLEVLPERIGISLKQHPMIESVIEVVLDLGRLPEARFPGSAEYLSSEPISRADLDYVINHVGEFSGDNRAGIESTLHRISAIRNRQGVVIGLTCRVGRCVFGVISIIRDLVELGKSMLLLGRPGVGKTTALREIARVLADDFQKRVVIIDTSNEIAGDGDIPHPGIGRARRMQVATPEQQHKIMIEAVENHMPEVIVIDEIGTELEALASRTIAERGVQLVATAHGNQLENLIKNPTLSDLVGGIQSVTLGDDEARRRGSQKSVLERKAPPTFEIAVEMLERTRWVIHENVAMTVDQLLRGREAQVQIRSLDAEGKVSIVQSGSAGPQWPPTSGSPAFTTAGEWSGGSKANRSGWRRTGRMEALPFDPSNRSLTSLPTTGSTPPGTKNGTKEYRIEQPHPPQTSSPQARGEQADLEPDDEPLPLLGVPDFDPSEFGMLPDYQDPGIPAADYDEDEGTLDQEGRPLLIYPYGVSRYHLDQAIRTLKLHASVTKDLDRADVVLALRSHVRNRSKIQQLAQSRQIPLHTVKANTLLLLSRALRRILNIDDDHETEDDLDAFIQMTQGDESEALEEARLAVEQIVIPKSQPVELLPRPAMIRKLQHELVEHYHLRAKSFGEEPNRRLRIYPD